MMQATADSAGRAPESPGSTGATEFKAVTGGETRDGGALLVSAYAVLWVILMAWIFLLWRKQAGLHARLDGLEREIDKAAANKPRA